MDLKEIYIKLTAKKCAFIAIFFWATAFVLTKVVLKEVDVTTLGVLRYFFASIIVIFILIKKKIPIPELKNIPAFIFAGFSGYAGYIALFNIATLFSSPSTLSVINALAPAITAIVAYFIFNERIKLIGCLSMGISFCGILILTLWDGVLTVNKGILYMLAGCLLLSLYNISQRYLTKKYSSFDVSMYSMLIGGILLVIYSPSSITNMFSISFTSLILIIYMSIFPSIISYFFWTKAFELAKHTTEVTSFMFVTPVLATLMGIIILGDIPKLSTLIGGVVIILGMILFNKTK
ncbi:EamA family transporter [Fusobacterium nucleatum subsp. nucleatum ATCC 25586]|uniref:EamA family transporter n=1 Tax=Fusobacterium nucleatum subsp. nucleatum (strain ATCC 25586 / DSM 15643 / BCRC 10681 / CIP 101130 / JCM 8532 / KCTC 2640 / LMG 13131 / VPI 4355) TaxID=190304 RepID=A0ABM6TPZ0_FUSNN|nr:DMT family transporter [Fusobacterium nucleatum]AVQ14824.1 EamA family transporter [Fusobacterium nucleatum subsp. nucleatum ATCC 25586]WMS29668.1 DMT family transporter [Fusobacterium nucleatum]